MFSILAYALIVATAAAAEDGLSDGLPEKKLISTFQIVRFPNDNCKGSNSRNGTCYTSAECSDKGGASSGSCADGFGVCCTFLISTCGSSSSENITYWTTPTTVSATSTVPTECTLKLCPINNNICQLRIDFTTFVITGPNTLTVCTTRMMMGVQRNVGANAVTLDAATWTTQCNADQFTVSGKSPTNSVPTICGLNTGEHIYVDANVQDCNVLNFQFSGGVIGTKPNSRGVTSRTTPKWDFTIYQYECGFPNSAPPGCLQYLYGPVTGKIKSFNYAAATVHLANQNQKVCIRRERDYCWGCFHTDGIAITFEIGGTHAATTAFTFPGLPCGYNAEETDNVGKASKQAPGYDCVIIPGAFVIGSLVSSAGSVDSSHTTAVNIRLNTQANARLGHPPQITGRVHLGHGGANKGNLNAVTRAGGTADNSICTAHVPFQLTFKSDHFEGTGDAGERGKLGTTSQDQKGFSIDYTQIKCTA